MSAVVRPPLLVIGTALVIVGQIVFVGSDAETPPAFGVLLLALGWALFTLGALTLRNGKKETWAGASDSAPESTDDDNAGRDRRRMIAALGIATLAMTLTRLAYGATTGWDVVPWLISLAAVAALFVPCLTLPPFLRVAVAERTRALRASLLALVRTAWIDAALVVALMGIFIGLNAHDLSSWRYSVVGDEYAFFFGASEILDGGLTRPFNQNGVYDRHPVMDIAYQAAVMKIFGGDHVGWVLSSLIAAALAIPGVYLLGYLLGGRKAAAVSATLFASSHYLFAFSHLGYNTLHALPVIVWSLAFFVLGLRRGNPLWLYLAGVVAGFGLYTIFSARILLPVMLAFILLNPARLALLRRSWPRGTGLRDGRAPRPDRQPRRALLPHARYHHRRLQRDRRPPRPPPHRRRDQHAGLQLQSPASPTSSPAPSSTRSPPSSPCSASPTPWAASRAHPPSCCSSGCLPPSSPPACYRPTPTSR